MIDWIINFMIEKPVLVTLMMSAIAGVLLGASVIGTLEIIHGK
jgi:hypothetical protein